MKDYSDTRHVMDARLAAWVSSVSPCAAGYYLYSDAALPEPEEGPIANRRDWRDPAATAVLRECYRRALFDPHLEMVEAAAIAVMPASDEDEEENDLLSRIPRVFRPPTARERWEMAVTSTAARVSHLLRYGPTAGMSGGEAVFAGGDLEAEVYGLRLRQRVDLLWRHPSRALEAVLIFEDVRGGGSPPPVEKDWRCILAAAVVSAIHGAVPRIHALWISVGVAQAVNYPAGHVEQKVLSLADAVSRAEEPDVCGETISYPLVPEAVEPLRHGKWPREPRPFPPGMPRR